MKVYDINNDSWSEAHCVVAETMGEAEAAYKAKYPHVRIESITVHAEYVIVVQKPKSAGGEA